MALQYLRKPDFSLIGYIRTDNNGWQWLHKGDGSCRGYYRPKINGTFRPNGNFVGWGNLLGTLI
jgi:hypothetical protein